MLRESFGLEARAAYMIVGFAFGLMRSQQVICIIGQEDDGIKE